MVYNTKDFEAFLLLYKAEGAPRNISIESFCQRNGVSYEIFDKWYRSVHKQIVPVEILNAPEGIGPERMKHPVVQQPVRNQGRSLKISIELEDGMTLSKQVSSMNEAYQMLKTLEGVLC